MLEATLIRTSKNDCVTGRIYASSKIGADSTCLATLELPWRFNLPMVSCIPAGSYICQFENHKKFGDTYKVLNVKGRSGIYIHRGNWTSQIRGCILIGTELVIEPSGRIMLRNSKEGHVNLMRWLMTNNEHTGGVYPKQFVLHIEGVG